MNKKELSNFLNWYRLFDEPTIDLSNEQIVDKYENYLIRTRRSERRANGSNSKAKEVCANCGELKSKHSKVTMLCPTIFAHYKQTD